MKKQEIKRFLRALAVLAFLIAECRGSSSGHSEYLGNSPDAHGAKQKNLDPMDPGVSSAAQSSVGDVSGQSEPKYFKRINEMENQSGMSKQYIAARIGKSGWYDRLDSMPEPVRKRKRKGSQMSELDICAIGASIDDDPFADKFECIDTLDKMINWIGKVEPPIETKSADEPNDLDDSLIKEFEGIDTPEKMMDWIGGESEESAEEKSADEIDDLDDSLIKEFEDIDTPEKMMDWIGGDAEQLVEDESSDEITTIEPDHSDKASKEPEKTLNKADSSNACPILQILVKKEELKKEELPNKISGASDSQETVSETAADISAEEFGTSLWTSGERLSNARRKSYRSKHKTVYKSSLYDAEIGMYVASTVYKGKFKKAIEDFCAKTVFSIDQNPLWYFIISRSTTICTKYKDLFGLKELFRSIKDVKYKKMVERLKGYYPGVFDDMIKYIQKNRPIKISKDKKLSVWKETVGDIYLREYLQLNYCLIDEHEELSQIDEKYHEVVYAMRMILTLPEVHQDFSSITKEHIKKTYTNDDMFINMQHNIILTGIHKLAQMHAEEEIQEDIYANIHAALEKIHGKTILEKLSAVKLYKEIYTIVGIFYENAEVIDKSKDYVLVGKPVITKQKYMKCRAVVNTTADACGRISPHPTYSLKINRWTVSSHVHEHYHVYYVDNATNQPRTLCMPVYEDGSGQKHYMHSIGDTVKYIKKLYKIKKESDGIYPFKMNKKSKMWSYIEKSEREQTVKDLPEYQVVFYRIEKDLMEKKFTFAEFRPLKEYDENNISIPLFLTPFMQAAVELGPFTRAKEHAELETIKFENKKASVYTYDEKYKGEKYSELHKYYCNLYIVPNKEKRRNTECYMMNCTFAEQADSTVEATWYVRMPSSSVNSYTHCILDEALKGDENFESFSTFIETVEERKYNKDSTIQSFWLKDTDTEDSEDTKKKQTLCNWIVDDSTCSHSVSKKKLKDIKTKISRLRKQLKDVLEEQKSLRKSRKNETVEEKRKNNSLSSEKYKTKIKLEKLHKELYIKSSRRPDPQAQFVVFRCVNESNSNLGAHNEILNSLIASYNSEKYPSNNK
ncbi:hypothetical protein NEMIN01_0449 [Nematocida minor]|uniref:uncharacterized protein n=1 Tax=Nematocida minor TaxID=1912983 RepID=UPI00221FA1E0|nr:uncharacterized protein NEMIN01_0449 [Nematocida minor]KAI5189386.1 hypothetical protein NEMIN01_0449 [Nematocida minor]